MPQDWADGHADAAANKQQYLTNLAAAAGVAVTEITPKSFAQGSVIATVSLPAAAKV